MITCAVDNLASRRACELIGVHLVSVAHLEREPSGWGDSWY
ncbi:MAG: hypothetical protein OXG37_04225 [Actinomycetia bacterium]|nr:hypothetical protein [Actinomycetes bacterium]